MEEQLADNPTAEMNPTDGDHLMESVSQSSDSDSGSDSEDEAQQSLQLQSLEAELSSNPSNYDAHAAYIKQLRKLGELDKLRKARESMSLLFPMTPTMWQEWAKDETSLSSGSETVTVIEQLYERGVSDYLSVPLWCDYLSFIQEHDASVRECSPVGLSKARSLFERALTAAGLHFWEGNKIWEAYKEFEQAIALTIDESDVESKTKQIQRVRTIFHRHLSVPLASMSLNLRAYKAWEVEQGNLLNVDSDDLDGISPHVATAYKKAVEMHDVRVSLEEQISKPGLSDSDRLQQFVNYLKFEESSGDPARVTVLYERGISEFPISSDLWLDYTRYLDTTLKVGKVLKDTYYRATRNCPWVGELWVRYLLSLERVHAPEEEMSTVFERALQCTFSSYEYLDLYLTRIDGLRRRISAAEEMQVLDYASIRGTFQRASDYLSPQLKGSDALWRLYSYWARLELFLVKDIAAARGVWESLLKTSGSMLEAWKGYIQMEIEQGNINEARSLYRRCYTKRFPGSGSEDICHCWLRFEREFGDLEDYDHALQKVTPRLEELRLYRLQQESKTVPSSVEQKDNTQKSNTREKRKAPSLADDSPAKRQKESKQAPKKEATVESNHMGKQVESEKKEESITKTEPDGKLDQPRKKPYQKYTDQCTAFISNLNVQTNVEHLRNFFNDVGGVVSIRILKDKFTGESRGLAYVDFSDEAHLTAAVAKNKKMLKGKKLSIAVSNPAQSKSKGGKPVREVAKDVKKSNNSTEGDNGRDATESIQFKGKNTFAVPRVVRHPRLDVNKGQTAQAPAEEEEKPKSNDEFRKMFVKS